MRQTYYVYDDFKTQQLELYRERIEGEHLELLDYEPSLYDLVLSLTEELEGTILVFVFNDRTIEVY